MATKKINKEKKIDESQKRIEELEEQVKRGLADYQNLEKRSREERLEWIRTANKDLITGMLPGLDALILAEKHTQDNNAIVAIKHFISELEKEGLKKIETEGKEFDPKSMECVQVKEGEDGMVLEETRPGFVLYDKVIRPVQVVVGKKGN